MPLPLRVILRGHHRRLVQDERLGRRGAPPADAMEIFEAEEVAGFVTRGAGPRAVPSPGLRRRKWTGLRRVDAMSRKVADGTAEPGVRGRLYGARRDRRGAAAGHAAAAAVPTRRPTGRISPPATRAKNHAHPSEPDRGRPGGLGWNEVRATAGLAQGRGQGIWKSRDRTQGPSRSGTRPARRDQSGGIAARSKRDRNGGCDGPGTA